MKKGKKWAVLLGTIGILSAVLAGCAGCGTTNDNNMNDMVESTPAATDALRELIFQQAKQAITTQKSS